MWQGALGLCTGHWAVPWGKSWGMLGTTLSMVPIWEKHHFPHDDQKGLEQLKRLLLILKITIGELGTPCVVNLGSSINKHPGPSMDARQADGQPPMSLIPLVK